MKKRRKDRSIRKSVMRMMTLSVSIALSYILLVAGAGSRASSAIAGLTLRAHEFRTQLKRLFAMHVDLTEIGLSLKIGILGTLSFLSD